MVEWVNAQDITDWGAVGKAFDGSALTSPSDGGDWLVYLIGAHPERMLVGFHVPQRRVRAIVKRLEWISHQFFDLDTRGYRYEAILEERLRSTGHRIHAVALYPLASCWA